MLFIYFSQKIWIPAFAGMTMLLLFFLLSIPLVVLAQAPDPQLVNTVLTNFLALLTIVIKILISLAFVVFGWGVVTFMFATRSGDAKKTGEAKQILLWGIIGIFVLASMGGIVIFIKTYFGIPDNAPIQPPTLDLSAQLDFSLGKP